MQDEIKNRLAQILSKLDLDGKRRSIRELEAESSHPDFWRDTQRATAKMKQMSQLMKELAEGETLERLRVEEKEDELAKALDRFEFALYLGVHMTQAMPFCDSCRTGRDRGDGLVGYALSDV